MRKLKLTALILAATAAVTSITLLSPVKAFAATAATCSGSGCNGTDPQSTGCASSAITAEETSIISKSGVLVGYVDLRYSTACKTAWARTVDYYSSSGGSDVVRSDGKYYGCGYYVGKQMTYSSTLGGYSCYSPQIYDHPYTSAGSGIAFYTDGILYTAVTPNY
jgi:hypothetical protein